MSATRLRAAPAAALRFSAFPAVRLQILTLRRMPDPRLLLGGFGRRCKAVGAPSTGRGLVAPAQMPGAAKSDVMAVIDQPRGQLEATWSGQTTGKMAGSSGAPTG